MADPRGNRFLSFLYNALTCEMDDLPLHWFDITAISNRDCEHLTYNNVCAFLSDGFMRAATEKAEALNAMETMLRLEVRTPEAAATAESLAANFVVWANRAMCVNLRGRWADFLAFAKAVEQVK